MKIYLASPLFTTAQRDFNKELARWLTFRGHMVWLPQERAPLGTDHKDIFASNLLGIKWSDSVVVNVDGEDTGTAWECGYAHAHDKLIVGFKTDFRPRDVNIMIAQSCRFMMDISCIPVTAVAEDLSERLQACQNVSA